MRALFRAAPAALVLLAALGGRATAQTGQKFAFIRSSVLLEQAPGRAEAEAQFEKEAPVYTSEMKRMSDSLDAMMSSYQKVQATLSASARETRAREIQARDAEYQRRTQELRQKAQQRQTELVQPIYDRVKAAIEDVRAEQGYSFVFNFDNGSSIVAADKNLDITDRVIAKLRTMSAAAPAPASRPTTALPAAAPSGVTRPVTPPRD
jgi:outer membrane protein